jgi:hypothetical protein
MDTTMKKSFVLLLVFLSCSVLSLLAQVNEDKDTIWTRYYPELWSLSFSPNNSKILGIGSGNRLYIFNTENSSELFRADSAWYLMVDSARNRVYTTFLKKIYSWDIDTYEKFDYFEPGEKDIQQPTYSAKNNSIAALMGNLDGAKNEGVIKVWDCASGKVIFTKTYGYFYNPETGHTFPPGIIEIKFNDGLNILSIFVQYGDYRNENDPWGSAYISKEIREVYDATTFEYKSDNPFLSNYFYMSESGKYVIIFARQQDGKDDMLVLQTSDYREVARFSVIDRENVSAIKITNDDKYLIYELGHIKVFDLIDHQEIHDYNVGTCLALDISSDNHYIVSSGALLSLLSTPWYTSVPYENDIDAVISFPNPASDYIDIRLDDVILSETKDLKINNSLGECVLNLTPALSEGEGIRIDVSQFAAGLYFLRVNAGDKQYSQKFIVTE